MAFQAEVYAIKTCADENIKRGYAVGTFTFSQTVKLQLNHLTTVKSTLGWSGIAINP
jgi:hypothetical protein